MGIARHPRPKELEEASVEQIATRYVGRFRDKVPDWAAFEDAKIASLVPADRASTMIPR